MLLKKMSFLLLGLIILGSMCIAQSSTNPNLNDIDPKILNKISNNKFPLNLQRVGAWPYGPSLSVDFDAQRNLIFLGAGGVVMILDNTDPANPQLLSDDLQTTGLVNDISYDSTSQRLYIAADEGGVEIWDVQDPVSPSHINTFEVLYFGVETPVRHIYIYDRFVIAETNWGYVHSIDVSDPLNPMESSFNGQMGNPSHDLHVSPDGYAHTTGQNGYYRFRIESNGSLNGAGAWYFTYGAGAVYGDSAYAYVGKSGYLYIFSLIPGGGGQVSSTNVNGITDLEVKNQTAYIINNNGLQIYDLTNPATPFFSGTLPLGYTSNEIVVHGNYAYIADDRNGIKIVDISNSSNPVQVGTYEAYSRTASIVIDGDVAFLPHYDHGLAMLDLSDISNPVLINQYDISNDVYDAKIQGSYAYLAAYNDGFKIVDISDLQNPTQVSSIDSINAWKIIVSGNYAYVVDAIPNQPYSIHCINISDPANPVDVGEIYMPDMIWQLAVYGDYVLAACYNDGLRIIDFSDPANPQLETVVDFEDVLDVCVRDTLAFVASADWQGGFLILNISDPTNPIQVSLYNPTGWFHPFDVAVSGNYAYVGEPAGVETFYLFDITDPANPVELETYNFAGDLNDIYAQDSLVFICDGAAGLVIYENELYSPSAATLSWKTQHSGTNKNLQSVYFSDSNTGWATGEDGVILHTNDAGNSWSQQNSGTTNDLLSVMFANNTVGWAVGLQGTILKTTDAGNSWNPINSGTTEMLSSLCFVNADTGWVVGEQGTILKTTDGGTTWQTQNSGTTYGLTSVDFVDSNHGWIAVTGFGMILKTSDGGTVWQSINTGNSNSMFAIDFVSVSTGWLTGDNGSVLKSTDGGNSWFEQNATSSTDCMHSVCFLDLNTGWISGCNGMLMFSNDGGNNWTEQSLATNDQLNCLSFIDDTTGWAVGENGIILKSTTEVISGVDEYDINDNQPNQYLLYNNYPNPFNPETSIRYNLPKSSKISLRIFNIRGEIVRTLVEEFQSAGLKSVMWDGKNDFGQIVSSGVYIYQLRSGGAVKTKKMTFLK